VEIIYAWVQRRLGEVADNIGTGRSVFISNVEKSLDSPYAVLGSTSVISYDKEFDHVGDFILTARVGANAGNLYRYSGKVKISDNTVYIQSKNLDFIFFSLSKFDLKSLSFGTGQPLIKASELKNLILHITNQPEQTAIGNFFRTLDNAIALLKRTLIGFKKLKKAYLQQMFPQEGETVPKIRFAGFKGEWKESKLGDVAEFKNGMNFSKEAMGHGFPFVNLQNIFGKTIVDISSLGLAESNEQQRKEYSLKKGDILFIRSSVRPEGVGEAAVIPCDLIDTTYSGFIIRCRIAGNFNDAFKQFLFGTEYFRCQMLNNATTSANTNINQDSLSKMLIRFPIKKEQSVVGNFFCNLDEQITSQQTKLENLKLLKFFYLQKMFI